MKDLTTHFLAQSYLDTYDDYNRSIKNANFSRWDYVILTASNEDQAKGYRLQIEERRKAGFLPLKTHFAVIPDEGGKRVGSGGATLGVIKYIAEKSGKADFSDLCVLVIHSGGDSKRVPQYSALGKLFSPVPRTLPNGRLSTLFDELMIAMSSVPARIRKGMLLLSGDVMLLFNPLQINFSGQGAAAISFKEDVETGKNHGVFLSTDNGDVRRFLHKQSTENLVKFGAVNQRNLVDIDTGAVVFSPEIVKSLYSLISKNNKFNKKKYRSMVNEKVRLSLYGDFLYPLATEATLDEYYQEKAEGELTKELHDARTLVWKVLNPFKMKVIRVAPSKFVHFGTSREIMNLMNDGIENFNVLGWKKQTGSSIKNQSVAAYNSVLSSDAIIGKNCYLEVSYVHGEGKVGDNVILSHIDIYDNEIPSNVILHGLKQKDGKFIARIYGVNDDPKGILEKDCTFLGQKFNEFINKYNIDYKEIWDNNEHYLWTAKLFPACDTIREAVKSALNLYNLVNGTGDFNAWLKANRKSLCSGFNSADSNALIHWNKRMQELVAMDSLAKYIKEGNPASGAYKILNTNHLSPIQKEWLEEKLEKLDCFDTMRLLFYIGKAIGGQEGENYVLQAFKVIQKAILNSSLDKLKYNDTCKIVKEEHQVKLPLRVNFGGGWSDTPPYCNQNGGTVLNASILLNGEKPVCVKLTKIKEKKIVFDSRDMDVHGEFTDIRELQNTGDPYDSFALQKAGLLASGIIPTTGGNLEEILDRLGGGFIMSSEVVGVPKGSGLGTSSILSAACIKALFEFVGIEFNNSDLYQQVLCMEQIMSTGGGWQDQVGGITGGISLLKTKAGLVQEIMVEPINISEQTKKELNDRFVLIYTGQRRLARNLLRDVVGRYIGKEQGFADAISEIQNVAVQMKQALESGNVDEFALLLDKHWSLSKQIDAGSTNTIIDYIYESIDDLVAGKLVCGAGGGGFLQAVLKKGVDKQTVRDRLKAVFEDNGVDVWDSTIL